MSLTVVILIGIGALLGLALVMLGILALCVPSVSQAWERARIEREAQEASWRIHQQAAAAFGQMLEAARQSHPGDDHRSQP